jgi:hypothetical protein
MPLLSKEDKKTGIINIAVIVINVGATLLPSNSVYGVCHGATAGCGASNDANFGRSGSLRMPPHSLHLPFCRPTGAEIPGEEEDDAGLVAAAHPSSWQCGPNKSTSTPLQSLLFYL